MPRKPMSGPDSGPLVETLSVGAVLRVIPLTLVTRALEETQKTSKRVRLLPAHLVIYLVIAMALNSHYSVQHNLRILLHSRRLRLGIDGVRVAGETAISLARRRLGGEPLAWLYQQIARPLAMPQQASAFWLGLRPMAVDATTIETPCTQANAARFGRTGCQHGDAGYPRVKIVALIECATHAVVGWKWGAADTDEKVLAESLWDRLQPDMLLLADRAYFSFHRWRDCSQRCGGLLWRVQNALRPEILSTLPDGSYLVRIRPSNKLIEKELCHKGESLVVRMIEYQPIFKDGTRGEKVRLFTTLLDPAQVSATELAARYPQRWTIETGFDELKTHLRGPDRILRSGTPDGVIQELHGFFLAYFVIRSTMNEAAARDGCAPTGLSFTHAVEVIRRHLTAFPPYAPMDEDQGTDSAGDT